MTIGGIELKQQRIDHLKKHLHTLNIDLENGELIGRVASPHKVDGHRRIKLAYKSYYVHEIIAVAGGLDVLNKDVHHIDGDPLNNKLSNLTTLTRSEHLSVTNKEGQVVYKQKYPESVRKLIRADYASGKYTQKILAEKYGIPASTVQCILRELTPTT